MDDPLDPFRSELRAFCYRMMGSIHDAEDALQEIGLRAWRAQDDFAGRSSRRTWLYRIATNACLNELARKERRVVPADLGPAESGVVGEMSTARHEVLWLEPFPDDPQDAAVATESLELAFVAALQHLTANQRAVLVLTDVLDYPARETAEILETTPGSVSSALRRAREAMADGRPSADAPRPSQDEERAVARRFADALRNHDVDALLALLAQDATWSMPPLPVWLRGHDAIGSFVGLGPFDIAWRHRLTRASGRVAVAAYAWQDQQFRGYALDVLDVRGDQVVGITSFLDGGLFRFFGLPDTVTG